MTKELTQEELMDYVHYAFYRTQEPGRGLNKKRKQAYNQIKELILQKPTVTRRWMNDLIGFAVVAAGTGDYKLLSKRLEELGVEVVDD